MVYVFLTAVSLTLRNNALQHYDIEIQYEV